MRDRGSKDSDRRAWIGPVVVALTFVVLTLWSWRKWSDLTMDFGRELYVPWQLSVGKTLYTDISYFNGPFSPYFNSLLFRIFGVSTTTLIFANLAILAITTGMIYALFNRACDRLTATVCCCLFLSVFALGELTAGGTYNFIAPYSHELTHGIPLTIGMILCLRQHSRTGSKTFVAFAGLLLGLVFLTKGEVFLAAVFAAVVGFALLHLDRKAGVVLFIGAALLPIVLFFALLAMRMPVTQALQGIAGTWVPVLKTNVATSTFYLEGAGFDKPLTSVVTMVRAALAVLLMIAGIAAADMSRKLPSRQKALALLGTVACLVLGWLVKRTTDPWADSSGLPVPWLLIGTALPLVSLAAGLVFIRPFIREATKEEKHRLFPMAVWTSFAFALLAKILLSARLYHYGFALAMPATLVLAACCVHFVPHALRKVNGGGDLFRRFILAALIADALFFVLVSNRVYAYKQDLVGPAGDAILVPGPKIDPRGVVVAKVLQRIEALMPPTGTFVVIPEGVALNYLSRRVNPTPYISFMPPEVAIFGETEMLAALQTNPPDFILLTPRNASEFNVKPFGTDPSYGKQIMDWANAHYSLEEDVGIGPESTIPFDIKILRRASR